MSMDRLIYLKDVVTLRMDSEKCIGCGMCLEVCPRAVFRMTNGTAEIANRDACIECGACSRNCPVEALNVQPGVGCAAAVIHSFIGKKSDSCCTLEPGQGTGGSCSGCC